MVYGSTAGVLSKEQTGNIGFIRTALDGLAHELMMGRQFACRVGVSRIAGKECGLATAAAKVDLSLWTGSAWLRHPFGPAKSVKAFGFFPDPGERLLADIIKSKPGDSHAVGHGSTEPLGLTMRYFRLQPFIQGFGRPVK